MREIQASEAKVHLPQLLDDVALRFLPGRWFSVGCVASIG
jgi:hypothetical protein